MRRVYCFIMALFAMIAGCRESYGQQYITTDADKMVAGRVLATLYEEKDLSTPELMVIAAKDLLGTEYVAGTLEEDPSSENLRVYLTKTDCILFVETCLNLARTARQAGKTAPGFDDFAANVARTRYRKKPPYTYGDRIHYTTEWIRRQEGSLEDMTMSLGGVEDPRPINFMTSHPKSYKQISDADNIPRAALDLKRISEVEEELNKVPMTYIPKDKIARAAEGIRSGDIICFVSSVEGLDIAHVGIALVENGRVGFIHASQADGKVEIDGRTIEEYVRPRSNLSGIKVVRPL